MTAERLLMLMGVATLAVIWWGTDQFGDTVGRTMGLTVFSILNVAFSWATKDELRSLFDIDVSGDRFLVRATILSVVAIVLATELGLFQRLLGTVSLTFEQWVVCTVLGLSILVVSEIKKRLWRADLDVTDAPAAQPTAAAPAA